MSADRTRIVVAVCTYRRNDPLRRLLEALARNAEQLAPRADVGVVVVDDNPDRRAGAVCEDFSTRFPLGLHYRTSGRGNISIARNIGLETALPLADWVAMTDDDCEPVDDWLSRLLDRAEGDGTDIVTGPCLLTAEDGPAWLREQPFLEDAQFRFDDGARIEVAATNNSMLRAATLRDQPDLRFQEELGVVGGEDMVFFRTARRNGSTISFAAHAAVRGHEPPERWTYAHQLRSRFWLGNTEFVTNRRLGQASRPRWAARGLVVAARGLLRPFTRLATGRSPQFRYAGAAAARGAGMLVGAIGIEVDHH